MQPTDPGYSGIWKADMNNDGVPRHVHPRRPSGGRRPSPTIRSCPTALQVPGDIYTFRVNTNTTNAQDQPSVAMDQCGNFVVTWVGTGQTVQLLQQR